MFKKILLILLALVAYGIYKGESKSSSTSSMVNASRQTQEREAKETKYVQLWDIRKSKINVSDYPNINKHEWCGLGFGTTLTPQENDFADYLNKYKEKTIKRVISLPASDLQGNLSGYETLICMEPDNITYRKKIEFYKSKVNERKSAAWSISHYTDEMTGKKRIYLNSENGTTIHPMEFPYSGTTSSISFGCDSKDEWGYFWFSKQPNITNGETESGYNVSKSRISFDSKVESITLTQEWGSKFMHVSHDKWFSDKLKNRKTLKLELSWHGQNEVIFVYDIKGFSPLYADFKKECSKL